MPNFTPPSFCPFCSGFGTVVLSRILAVEWLNVIICTRCEWFQLTAAFAEGYAHVRRVLLGNARAYRGRQFEHLKRAQQDLAMLRRERSFARTETLTPAA